MFIVIYGCGIFESYDKCNDVRSDLRKYGNNGLRGKRNENVFILKG